MIFYKTKKAMSSQGFITSVIVVLIVLVIALMLLNQFHGLSLGFVHKGAESVSTGLLG